MGVRGCAHILYLPISFFSSLSLTLSITIFSIHHSNYRIAYIPAIFLPFYLTFFLNQVAHSAPFLLLHTRQLKWVMKKAERFERFETLISISTDGSVLEWTTKKGFAVSTLMQLKRAGMVSHRLVKWVSQQMSSWLSDWDSEREIRGDVERDWERSMKIEKVGGKN